MKRLAEAWRTLSSIEKVGILLVLVCLVGTGFLTKISLAIWGTIPLFVAIGILERITGGIRDIFKKSSAIND